MVILLSRACRPGWFCRVSTYRCAQKSGATSHHDLAYGNYFGGWRQRNALKLWTGWPTLPMVFVRGSLVGGADDLIKLIDSGELKQLL